MAAHEVVPQPGTVYSVGPANAACPASLLNALHYPVEAVCMACGKRIVCDRMVLGRWRHEERRPS